MKSLWVGLVLIAATWSASAGDLRGTGVLHQPYFSQVPPACLIGQTRVPIYDANGKIVGYVCVGAPIPMTPHW